jgi:hypothetical protein
MGKVGDGPLDLRHLLSHQNEVVVDILKLIVNSCFDALEPLANALLVSPMASSCHILILSIKVRVVLSTCST